MRGAGNDCRHNSRERIRADRASRRRGRRAGARRHPFHRVPARPVRRFNRRRWCGPPTDDRHRPSHAVHLRGSVRHHLSGPVTFPASRQHHFDGVRIRPVTREFFGSGAHACSPRVVRTALVPGDAPRSTHPCPSHPPSLSRLRSSSKPQSPRVKTHAPCASTHRLRPTMSPDPSEREHEPGGSWLCFSKSGCGTRMGARRCAPASPLPLPVSTAAR
jgi:hypothetical protein